MRDDRRVLVESRPLLVLRATRRRLTHPASRSWRVWHPALADRRNVVNRNRLSNTNTHYIPHHQTRRKPTWVTGGATHVGHRGHARAWIDRHVAETGRLGVTPCRAWRPAPGAPCPGADFGFPKNRRFKKGAYARGSGLWAVAQRLVSCAHDALLGRSAQVTCRAIVHRPPTRCDARGFGNACGAPRGWWTTRCDARAFGNSSGALRGWWTTLCDARGFGKWAPPTTA